jgi:hypothetical protein
MGNDFGHVLVAKVIYVWSLIVKECAAILAI